MQKANLQVGMRVYFGRPNGEKTLGEIVKLNPTKAKVKTLEERGRSDRNFVGQVWGVPYSLIEPTTESKNTIVPKMQYNPFSKDNLLLEALLQVHSDLSPENLTGDGELPYSVVCHRRAELDRKLKGLRIALGREISESEIYDWHQSKQEYGRTPPKV